ncbi:response regulator transcription factor [Lacinutrix jangbogonensis]|uniref:response regulator transcription factor n=1 Tax=Lacinutrix jangbogonensis TaxID=1469557 RepID=UPI0019D2D560|nr:helix-turn-helix transcriptional regulator [Lacinutrix jangbogonensis]
MSKRMIIAETNIDTSGNFSFDIDFLPKEMQLYRVHISKKNTSAASLIIGGKDENHFFIIANNKSNIQLKNTSTLFNDFEITNSKPNRIIRTIDSIVKEIDNINFKEFGIKNEFITQALNEKLRQIADTTSYSLVSLYALNKSKFEVDIKGNEQFYLNYLDKWKNEKSSYFKDFKQKIQIKQKSEWPKLLILGLTCFALGFGLNHFFSLKKNKSNKKLKLLSIQERKIFALLKEGKSNKEISDECNISLSTAKSHVSSIYSKLNVNSRKEIIDINS